MSSKELNFTVTVSTTDPGGKAETFIQEEISKLMRNLVDCEVISGFNIKSDSSQRIFTGHYDSNGRPIYVGDTVVEGCNNLEAKVEFNVERGAFWLEGLGDGYGIEDSNVEWTVINKEG